MIPAELYLTDEFVAFSKEMAEIHALKKEKKDAFKKLLDAFQSETKAMDEQAALVTAKWDAWVAEKGGSKKAG